MSHSEHLLDCAVRLARSLTSPLIGCFLILVGLSGCAPATEAPAPEASTGGRSAHSPTQYEAPAPEPTTRVTAPPPEAPPPEVTTAPPTVLPRTGGPVPEPAPTSGVARASTPADPAPAVRTYLAEHFIYAPWYRSILRVEPSSHHGVVVALSPSADMGVADREICQAILGSRYVGRATVRSSASQSAACPERHGE